MKERMEAAVEERDRIEDEASTNARRRSREVDELKNKVKDAERDLKRAEQDRGNLERLQKDLKKREELLESSSEKAQQEANEIRGAMGTLRDALDQSEKQARDAEKQKADLRRLLDEANQRYEKLQKAHRAMSEKLASSPSGRPSIDGSSIRSSSTQRDNNNAMNGNMDYVYLKTILLQFLEQKDKRHQAQLVPVLGKLLHFDK